MDRRGDLLTFGGPVVEHTNRPGWNASSSWSSGCT